MSAVNDVGLDVTPAGFERRGDAIVKVARGGWTRPRWKSFVVAAEGII